ncbi:uncharacterized protein [Drosophila kikkawai]|uniref:Uncharacterized protein n=1 Tax=Drosophila kikkawai TaxID=30033 RepID=A0A6P4ILZ8_DROKI|nr:uncharacterized protein LOC108076288 [Drosophila kikkawai]
MSFKLMPGWDKPMEEPVVHAASKNPAGENEVFFAAPHKYNLALTRGFYFSLRLPDWARDFKLQTREILSHRFDPLMRNYGRKGESLKQSNPYGDSRSERYGLTYLESPFFEGVTREKARRGERLPKIKDDWTCRKRVTSPQMPLP